VSSRKYDRVLRDVAHARQRADADAAARALDGRERNVVDVDEARRMLDVGLHQVDEVRAAGDVARA
jgi:uncharacterized protein YdeI (YjbR/CyaY-like superfamily)